VELGGTTSVLALNTDANDGNVSEAEADRAPNTNGFAKGFNESFFKEMLPDVW
jgi:hypothetical protein